MRTALAKIFRYWKVSLLVLLAASNLFVWLNVWRAAGRGVTVAFLNVGQGDSIFIEAPNGNQVLIDGGPDDSVLRELPKLMAWNDRSIDLLVLSHPHSDHLDGLISVLRRYQVGAVLESKVQVPNAADYAEWRRVITDEKIPDLRAARGEQVNLGDGVTLAVLTPFTDWSNRAPKNAHEAMVVTRLAVSSSSVIFTGDMEKALENQLLAAKNSATELDSDILKIGHHGSQTSTGAPFLVAVSPAAAVISVGAKNRYGLPFPGTLEILSKSKIPLYRTDELGTIIFRSRSDSSPLSST